MPSGRRPTTAVGSGRPSYVPAPPLERSPGNWGRRQTHVPFWDAESGEWWCFRRGCNWNEVAADRGSDYHAELHFKNETDETMRACEKRAEREAGA